jgi:hypothetical protein
MIIDERDNKIIEYLAMPIEVIKDGDMPVPEIDYEETEGFDGVTRSYISVKWQKVKDGNIVKKHDVAGHIVMTGCEIHETSKGEDGQLQCIDKSVYTVLHPAEEWVEQHVITLEKNGKIK